MDIAAPGVRRHCAHEVAFVVLCGLERSFRARGQHDAAARTAGLRAHLPVSRFAAPPRRQHRAAGNDAEPA